MTVKLRVVILTIFLLCATSIVSAELLLPAEFYGTVDINGSPAPAGTYITSVIDNQVTGFVITKVPGVFGSTGFVEPRLPATGITDGQIVSFGINGILANQTAVYHPGATEEIALTFTGVPLTSTAPVTTGQAESGTIGSYGSAAQSSLSAEQVQLVKSVQYVPVNSNRKISKPAAAISPVLTQRSIAAVPPAQLAPVEEQSRIPAPAASETSKTSDPTTTALGYLVIVIAGLVVACIGFIARSWLK